MADESSRLLESGAEFRTCSIAKNGSGYIPGKEYSPTTPDTISDGDNRGRDPQNDGGSIGTNIDIQTRSALIVKNNYTSSKEYGLGHVDTISDGDNKGRDPQNDGGSIGTSKDIQTRNTLMAKNSDGYTVGSEYCAGSADTIADGDNKGREPQQGGEAGTFIDFSSRTCSVVKNLYKNNNQYCAGGSNV